MCKKLPTTYLGHIVSVDGFIRRMLSFTGDYEVAVPELMEILQKLFVPNYQLVKSHMQEAIYEGTIQPNLPPGFYWQEEIDRVLKEIEKGML